MNQVTISGHLTRDPEVRTFDSGSTKASFCVAVSSEYKAKDGTQKKITTYVDCACWGRLAAYVGELRKGQTVTVNGELKTESWQDKQTQARRSKMLVNASRVDADAGPGGKHVAAPPANERRAGWVPAKGPPIDSAEGDYPVVPEPPSGNTAGTSFEDCPF